MEEVRMSKNQILIVDDDPDQRLTLRLPLEAAGYLVAEAKNSAEGLQMVKSVKPDLIILDVMMDTATAGFQLALAIHSSDPDSEFTDFKKTPIVMLTAIHTTTPLRFAPDQDYLPVEDFLEKPIDPEVLLKKVKELIEK
jgi:two-component system alkaline phosphatase synthesis response regulator PhoP